MRGVGTSGVIGWLSRGSAGGRQGVAAPLPGGSEVVNERDNRTAAATAGGASFNDSRDLATAIHTTVEDAANTCVLSFSGVARGRTLEIRARSGCFASRQGTRAPAPAASDSFDAVLNNPLDATVIVDLHDIYFATKDGRHAGSLAFSFVDADSRETETSTYRLNFTDTELAVALKNGLKVTKTLAQPLPLRFVARDVTTGSSGSLWIPPPSNSPR